MNIGVIDVDGHNYPNLALMKLSAWHKLQGDIVSWYSGIEHYNRVYMSKVFGFTPDDGRVIQADGNFYSKPETYLEKEESQLFPVALFIKRQGREENIVRLLRWRI